MNILVILAHPDDPEFFCGGTLARWIKAGHKVSYCLLTSGEKGSINTARSPEQMAAIRQEEQRQAALTLGVENVEFLLFSDGELLPDLNSRKAAVKMIRKHKPDVLVTSDPQNYFHRQNYLNHPDHRIAGQIVLDAYFPASGSPMYYQDLAQDGFPPHTVKEIWVSLTTHPNITIDVTDTWEMKINALLHHKSQIGDPDAFISRMKNRHTENSTSESPRYEESFYRIIFGI